MHDPHDHDHDHDHAGDSASCSESTASSTAIREQPHADTQRTPLRSAASGAAPPDRADRYSQVHDDDDTVAPGPASTAELDPLIGQRLGPFVIEDRIGRGGFSTVYRARHDWLDTLHALKVVHPPCTPAVLERFRQEARIGLRLRHPNVATVCMAGLDTPPGSTRPLPWIASDLIDGTSVSRMVIGHGAMDGRTAALIAVQVLDGLTHAHREGVLHGDVKPGNILVLDDGTARLVDFGLAIEIGASRGRPAGTVGFIAPELWHTPPRMDRRADIFSMGVTLWTMLSGRYPRTRDGQHVPELPQLTIVDPGLLDIVMRMTAADVDLRYHSAADARYALQDWMNEMSAVPIMPRGDGGGMVGRRTTTTLVPRRRPSSLRRPANQPVAVLFAAPPSADASSLQRVLDAAGYRVTRADEPQLLIDRFADPPPEALLLDPALMSDGYEMVRSVRERWPGTVVVLIADGAEPNDRLRGLMCGADRYLARPCSPMRVINELSRLLRVPGPASASTPATETQPLGG
ncbi:MAG: protein kinase [Planctomycetota bacterium]